MTLHRSVHSRSARVGLLVASGVGWLLAGIGAFADSGILLGLGLILGGAAVTALVKVLLERQSAHAAYQGRATEAVARLGREVHAAARAWEQPMDGFEQRFLRNVDDVAAVRNELRADIGLATKTLDGLSASIADLSGRVTTVESRAPSRRFQGVPRNDTGRPELSLASSLSDLGAHDEHG